MPALLAGNSVILKMAAQTPLVAERYAEAFKAAGLPDGVFQFLHLSHDQVAKIIADPRIAFVAFTGSVPGGHAIQRAAAERFIATGLELGGKDPAYVRADADLKFAVENLVDGSYFNSGQSCCGIERIYVDKQLFKTFVEGFVELTRQYRLGNPLEKETNLGPLVRTDAADSVRAQIKQATRKGAKALLKLKDKPGTPYLPPEVLVNVDHGMEVMTEETLRPGGRHPGGEGRRGSDPPDERQPLRPHRLDLDAGRRRRAAHRRPRRDRHLVHEPLRLPRSRPRLDRRQGLRPRLHAVEARARDLHPPEVVPPAAQARLIQFSSSAGELTL